LYFALISSNDFRAKTIDRRLRLPSDKLVTLFADCGSRRVWEIGWPTDEANQYTAKTSSQGFCGNNLETISPSWVRKTVVNYKPL
jgi:hypothetical protein